MDTEQFNRLRARAIAAMEGLNESADPEQYYMATELAIYHAELEAQHEELIEANHRITEQMQEVNALFNDAPTAYFILDSKAAITRWNQAALTLPLQARIYEGIFLNTLFISHGHITLREWLLKVDNSDPLIVVSKKNPDLICQLNKRSWTRGQTMLSVTDITVQYQSEVSAQAQRADAFAYLAHELRTPAATLAMMLEANTELAATYDGIVMKATIDQMLSVMEDLSTVLSPSTDNFTIRAGVELRQLITEVVNIARPQLESHGIACHLDLDAESQEQLWINANERAIRQIVTNLLKNVAVHSQANNAWVSVRIEKESHASLISLIVSDDGNGVAPEDRERIFGAFEQGSASGGGMGIGLDLSRKLALLMDGTLVYSDREGGGSCFTLCFLSKPLNAGTARAEATAPADSIDGLSVLVVEDESNIRRLARTMLQKAGATVDVAADGIEGLRKLEESVFDLILVDFMMPRMNGVAFIKAARDYGFTGNIVGTTAAMLGSDSQDMILAGANTVINKPLKLTELIARLA